jgi:hypothetical protein
MTIIQFNTDITYIAPDIERIKSTLNLMLKQNAELEFAYSETNYLPSIRAKAQVLYTSLALSQRTFNEQLSAIDVAITKALRNLNKYRAAVTEDMSEDDLEANTYARAQTVITFKKSLAPAVQALQQQFKALADVSFDPTPTTTYKDGLLAELEPLGADVAMVKAEIAKVETARGTLNDAMAVLEKDNFVGIAKDTLLTAENISAAGLAAPEVELVKLAVEQMKKTLEHIGEALNYITMSKQRDGLIKKLSELKTRNAVLDAEERLITSKTNVIVSIHSLFESFFGARAEYAKIDQSINAFVDHLALAEQADYEDRLVAAAPSLIAFLNDAR